MSLQHAYQIEREKWDAKARSCKDLGNIGPWNNFEEYAQNVLTMQGIGEFFGPLKDKHVLEIGCGLGQVTTLMAESGAYVTAFDLSPVSVQVTRARVREFGVADHVEVLVAPGEKMPFADESFDLVFGRAILHHLNISLGAAELRRVMKTGGKAAFSEPMGMNPLLNFAREYVPYPGKNVHGVDVPLTYKHIRAWGQGFSQFEYHEVQLFSMLERALGHRKRVPFLRKLDAFLLPRAPFLRRFCRYVTILMVK